MCVRYAIHYRGEWYQSQTKKAPGPAPRYIEPILWQGGLDTCATHAHVQNVGINILLYHRRG